MNYVFYKFLGVHSNKLFILSEAGRIFVLDWESGNLIKEIHSENFPIMRDAFMHPENHNIYCLHNWFVKINTETLEVERVGLHDCSRLNCSIKHTHTANDYFRWVISK